MVAVWRQPRLYLYGRESPARLTLYLSDGSAPGDSCKEKKTITFRIHAPIVYQHDEGNNRRETGVAIPLVTPSHRKQKSEKRPPCRTHCSWRSLREKAQKKTQEHLYRPRDRLVDRSAASVRIPQRGRSLLPPNVA